MQQIPRLIWLVLQHTDAGALTWENDDENEEWFAASFGQMSLRFGAFSDGTESFIVIAPETTLALHSIDLAQKEVNMLKFLRSRMVDQSEQVHTILRMLEEPTTVKTDKAVVIRRPPPEPDPELPPEDGLASEEDLQRLADTWGTSGTSPQGTLHRMPVLEFEPIEEALSRLGPPTRNPTGPEMEKELSNLLIVANGLEFSLPLIEEDVRNDFMSMLFARANYVKHECGFRDVRFSALYASMKDAKLKIPCGYLNGYSINDRPELRSWHGDALRRWEFLIDVDDDLDLPTQSEPVAKPKTKRRSVKLSKFGEDWPHFPLTEGKRVLVVGGDTQNNTIQQMKRDFKFKSVDWAQTDTNGKIKAAIRKATSGDYDIIFSLTMFLRGLGRTKLIKMCNDLELPLAVVESGYGVGQMRAAFEEAVVRGAA